MVYNEEDLRNFLNKKYFLFTTNIHLNTHKHKNIKLF